MDAKSLPNCAKCGELLYICYPVQCSCGDRLCPSCFGDLSRSNTFSCPLCKNVVTVKKCFRDKAVVFEFRKSEVHCKNLGCHWRGIGDKYEEHQDCCAFALVSCYYEKYGCTEKTTQSNIAAHEVKCQFIPQQCFLCQCTIKDEKVHLKENCRLVPLYCPNDCGEKVARMDMNHHLKEQCARRPKQCDFSSVGCGFMGHDEDLKDHLKLMMQQHLLMVQQQLIMVQQVQRSNSQKIADVQAEMCEIRRMVQKK